MTRKDLTEILTHRDGGVKQGNRAHQRKKTAGWAAMLIRPLIATRLWANAREGHQLYTSQKSNVSRPPSLRRSHLPRFSPKTRRDREKNAISPPNSIPCDPFKSVWAVCSECLNEPQRRS